MTTRQLRKKILEENKISKSFNDLKDKIEFKDYYVEDSKRIHYNRYSFLPIGAMIGIAFMIPLAILNFKVKYNEIVSFVFKTNDFNEFERRVKMYDDNEVISRKVFEMPSINGFEKEYVCSKEFVFPNLYYGGVSFSKQFTFSTYCLFSNIEFNSINKCAIEYYGNNETEYKGLHWTMTKDEISSLRNEDGKKQYVQIFLKDKHSSIISSINANYLFDELEDIMDFVIDNYQ